MKESSTKLEKYIDEFNDLKKSPKKFADTSMEVAIALLTTNFERNLKDYVNIYGKGIASLHEQIVKALNKDHSIKAVRSSQKDIIGFTCNDGTYFGLITLYKKRPEEALTPIIKPLVYDAQATENVYAILCGNRIYMANYEYVFPVSVQLTNDHRFDTYNYEYKIIQYNEDMKQYFKVSPCYKQGGYMISYDLENLSKSKSYYSCYPYTAFTESITKKMTPEEYKELTGKSLPIVKKLQLKRKAL